jgi:restriction system protein
MECTIEALGQGKQTILIRKYSTLQKEFLFYPTVSYASKDHFFKFPTRI